MCTHVVRVHELNALTDSLCLNFKFEYGVARAKKKIKKITHSDTPTYVIHTLIIYLFCIRLAVARVPRFNVSFLWQADCSKTLWRIIIIDVVVITFIIIIVVRRLLHEYANRSAATKQMKKKLISLSNNHLKVS